MHWCTRDSSNQEITTGQLLNSTVVPSVYTQLIPAERTVVAAGATETCRSRRGTLFVHWITVVVVLLFIGTWVLPLKKTSKSLQAVLSRPGLQSVNRPANTTDWAANAAGRDIFIDNGVEQSVREQHQHLSPITRQIRSSSLERLQGLDKTSFKGRSSCCCYNKPIAEFN